MAAERHRRWYFRLAWRLATSAGRLYSLFHYGPPLLGAVSAWIALHILTKAPWYLGALLAVAVFLTLLWLVGLAARLGRRKLDTTLADDCRDSADGLQRLLSDQQAFAVPGSGGEAIRNLTHIMDLYRERFENDVVSLVDVAKARGVSDQELDFYAPHPTNPLGIQKVAQRLAVVATRLRA